MFLRRRRPHHYRGAHDESTAVHDGGEVTLRTPVSAGPILDQTNEAPSCSLKLEVPDHWSQVRDILRRKLPQGRRPTRSSASGEHVPSCLWRSAAASGSGRFPTTSAPRLDRARQFVASPARDSGAGRAVLTTEYDARAFFDEHSYMLAMRWARPTPLMVTPASLGYGSTDPPGHYYVARTGELTSIGLQHPSARLRHPVIETFVTDAS